MSFSLGALGLGAAGAGGMALGSSVGGGSGIGLSLLGGIGSAASSAAPSLIGGLFGNYQARKAASANKKATLYTNQMNYAIAQETNAANARMAQQQMDFQKMMSNTAYQRAVRDLRKAGLNPILAALNSGASTPPGAAATMQAARMIPEDSASYIMQGGQVMSNALQNAGDAALKGIKTSVEALHELEKIGLTKKQTGQVEAAKNKLIAEIGLVSSQTSKNFVDAAYTSATIRQVDFLNKKIAAETEKLRTDKSLSEDQRKKVQQDIVESKKRLELIAAQTAHYLDAKRHGPMLNTAYSIVNDFGSDLFYLFDDLRDRATERGRKFFPFGTGAKWRE